MSIDVRQLELTSQESIESCVDGVVQTHGRLDALVNNAGIAKAPVAASVGVTVSLVEPAAVLDTSLVASSTLDPAAVLAAACPYGQAFRAYRSWVASGAVEGAQTAAEVAWVMPSEPALRG